MTGAPSRAIGFKVCGLTRAADAEAAAAAGASYVGVIFAGGPRLVTAAQAAEVIRGLPKTLPKVGVFGAQAADEVARVADRAGLDIVQLHGDPGPDAVARCRTLLGRPVWGVVRIAGDALPPETASIAAVADALVLDAKVPGTLGGSGVPLPWRVLGGHLASLPRRGALVLAGGLRPGNVAEAVRAIGADVLDVSSGVEVAPGIKDPSLVRAFGEAVRAASATTFHVRDS